MHDGDLRLQPPSGEKYLKNEPNLYVYKLCVYGLRMPAPVAQPIDSVPVRAAWLR